MNASEEFGGGCRREEALHVVSGWCVARLEVLDSYLQGRAIL